MMGWTEFDMKLKDDFIYFSGVSHYVDTCFNFINVIRQQESVKGFPGETLPSTAFYFSKQGITDWASLLSYGGTQEYATAGRTSEVLNRDRQLSRYLAENTGRIWWLVFSSGRLSDGACGCFKSLGDGCG